MPTLVGFVVAVGVVAAVVGVAGRDVDGDSGRGAGFGDDDGDGMSGCRRCGTSNWHRSWKPCLDPRRHRSWTAVVQFD